MAPTCRSCGVGSDALCANSGRGVVLLFSNKQDIPVLHLNGVKKPQRGSPSRGLGLGAPGAAAGGPVGAALRARSGENSPGADPARGGSVAGDLYPQLPTSIGEDAFSFQCLHVVVTNLQNLDPKLEPWTK